MSTKSHRSIPLVQMGFMSQLAHLSKAEKLIALFEKYGDIVAISQREKFFAVNDVDAIGHILRDNSEAYDKHFPLYDRVKFFLGDGLLTHAGDVWRQRRKLIQPHFTHYAMPEVFSVTVEKTKEMILRWKRYAREREAFDLGQELLTLMLQISSKVLFHHELDYSKSRFLVSAYGKTQCNVNRAISMNPWFPSLAQWKARITHAQIGQAIEEIIKNHVPQVPADMLDTLLTATRCPMASLSQHDVHEEMRTFLGGGHETTGSGLVWTMATLLQHPEYVERLQHELTTVLDKRDPVYEDLPSLTLNKMIFQEGLRLYPPIWITGRRLLRPDVLCGYSIPEESTVTICMYALHRDECHWEEPDLFNPYRFTQEAVAARHKYAYLPFGAGSRGCIAQLFSMIQGPMVLAMLMQNFEFELLSNDFSHELFFTIRPKYPVYVRVKER
ncbi:MAG: cytochrome P450 [Gammaproteobacteria bacterium]|nr:cytochrome P450 [Gammaproteobacteria bacterium]